MFKIVVLLVFTILCMANNTVGSYSKGKVYYKYLIKEKIDIRGDIFAKKHTSREWLALFENNASLFKKQFLGINPQLDELFESPKFLEIMPHLKAFVVHYAKDKKNHAQCEEQE